MAHQWEEAESNDPLALKEKLINSILKDESIRNLLRSDAVEDREVNYHRSRQEEEKVEEVEEIDLEQDDALVKAADGISSNVGSTDVPNRSGIICSCQRGGKVERMVEEIDLEQVVLCDLLRVVDGVEHHQAFVVQAGRGCFCCEDAAVDAEGCHEPDVNIGQRNVQRHGPSNSLLPRAQLR